MTHAERSLLVLIVGVSAAHSRVVILLQPEPSPAAAYGSGLIDCFSEQLGRISLLSAFSEIVRDLTRLLRVIIFVVLGKHCTNSELGGEPYTNLLASRWSGKLHSVSDATHGTSKVSISRQTMVRSLMEPAWRTSAGNVVANLC